MRKNLRLIVSAAVLAVSSAASAQTPGAAGETCPAQFDFSAAAGYAFHGIQSGTVRSFQSTPEARSVVKGITDTLALPSRFTVCAADVPNAHAILTKDGRRYIVYSAKFMTDLQASTGGTYWSLVSIMAHEVGHHLAFHNYDNTEALQAELEADLFSGFIVAKLGAKLAEATAAMEKIGTPFATPTHPALKDRVEAIRTGWNRAVSNGAANARPAPDRSVAPQAATRIEKLPGKFVEGDGYQKTKAASYETCETRCLADARCLMLEFYRPDQLCNLFAKPGNAQASTAADVGMKRSAVTSIAPAKTGTGIRRFTDRYVEGDGYAKSQTKDYDTCAARCQADAKCLMVEYFKPTKSCNQFSEARGHFPSKEADVGLRQ